jgi:hypothetical protein
VTVILGTLEVGCGVVVDPGAPAPKIVHAEIKNNKVSMQLARMIKREKGGFIMRGEL